ncbi:unnamed protein product [Brassicogethes aeneus]|uniref:Uncharacterized protein n=1 Tax=Brassicogethes aeneus TaxID=1431903 RepID=A0A9P0FKE9_BRAAE|nr:unnamed protein product [Brassicogethes aeneus]
MIHLIAFLFLATLCESSVYKGVTFYQCTDNGQSQCEVINPNKQHYRISPDTVSLNKTTFAEMSEIMSIIGTPGLLTEIEPGTFSSLASLKRIWLGGNLLKVIPNGVFNYLPIYYIYLAANNINTIDSEAFSEMDSLSEVYLDKNSLTHFDRRWFLNQGKKSKLRVLNMHHNRIKSINKWAFYDFPYLKELDFSFNEIEYVSNDLFNSFLSLLIFDLSFNRITTLSPNLLKNVRYVEKFNVAFNYLRSLDSVLLEKAYIKSASIHPNNWICECLKNVEKSLLDMSILSYSSDETFMDRKNIIKYQLPVNAQYFASNLSICINTKESCKSNNLEVDENNEVFKSALTKVYDNVNVKCNVDKDCSEGMLCRSNYCWYLITKAFFNVNDDYYFIWDTYVSF